MSSRRQTVRAKRANDPGRRAGRQYHIGLAPGEVAPVILLVGDPARARRIAARLESPGPEACHREFVTITGRRRGRPLSVMATGIGCDNTEIAVVELCRLVERPTFLRVGTCGALRPGVDVGHLCLSTGALRLESTSLAYVDPGYPALAHHEVLLATLAAARAWAAGGRGRRWHAGITATAPGFYGAQGRDDDPRFPSRFPRRVEQLRRQGVLNMEMEMSTLLTLASLGGARAGGLCAVYANRAQGRFATEAQQPAFQDAAIDVALRATDVLAAMDAARGRAEHWAPEELLAAAGG
jgi:uridine phosphorylase